MPGDSGGEPCPCNNEQREYCNEDPCVGKHAEITLFEKYTKGGMCYKVFTMFNVFYVHLP